MKNASIITQLQVYELFVVL